MNEAGRWIANLRHLGITRGLLIAMQGGVGAVATDFLLVPDSWGRLETAFADGIGAGLTIFLATFIRIMSRTLKR